MEIFDIQLVYFIFALILGFIIGILLKKSSAGVNMKKKVEEFEKEFYLSRDRLDKKSEEYFDTKNKFQINKDLIDSQNNLEKRSKDSINDYKKKITAIQEANKNLEDELTILNKEIATLESDINSYKKDYNSVNSIVKEVEKLKLEEKNLLFEIEENENNIKKFTDNKISLTTKLFSAKKDLSTIEHEIELFKDKMLDLKRQKNILKNKNYSSIDDEYEKAKTKMLNYKYKVKELEEQLKNGLKIDKEEINNFISKNESERFIDKLFLKIFNNSEKRGI